MTSGSPQRVAAPRLARPGWQRPARLLALTGLVLGLLAGCGSSGPTTRDQFYALEPEVRVAASTRPVAGSLLVTPLASRGFLGGTQILFRTAAAPLQVQRYDRLLWDGPPGRALAEALIGALRTANVFQYVISVADRAQADFTLNGELTRLEHLPTASPPQVSVAFDLALVAQPNRSIQLTRSYSGTEPTLTSTPEGMVSAFNRLTGRLLSQAVADIQRQAPRLRQRTSNSDSD